MREIQAKGVRAGPVREERLAGHEGNTALDRLRQHRAHRQLDRDQGDGHRRDRWHARHPSRKRGARHAANSRTLPQRAFLHKLLGMVQKYFFKSIPA